MNYHQGATFWRSTGVQGNQGKTLASKRLDLLFTFVVKQKVKELYS
jgi:hypothetical protein